MAEDVDYRWKGAFGNVEVNALHVEAFQTRVFTADEWNWQTQLAEHSFGWVTARWRSIGRMVSPGPATVAP
jgi:hypothetical protein